MRSVFLLLVLWLSVPSARAACNENGVRLYPAPGSVVPTNTRLLLEGLGAMAKPVGELPGRILRLQSEGHVVEVKVQRGWSSMLGRTMVILKPSEVLKAGRVYTLRLDDVLPGAKVINSPRTLPEWHSGRGQDLARPQWLKQPVVSEGRSSRTREGSERFVKLRMGLAEDSPAYAQVTLNKGKDKDSVAPQHYILPLQDGVAMLGHEACGGAFALEDGKSYRAKIDVFDAAGNLLKGVAPLLFDSPVRTQED